jgi:hypothetical protein
MNGRAPAEEKHAEFEEIPDVGRRFFRMRDERGLARICQRWIVPTWIQEEGDSVDSGVIYRGTPLCRH